MSCKKAASCLFVCLLFSSIVFLLLWSVYAKVLLVTGFILYLSVFLPPVQECN